MLRTKEALPVLAGLEARETDRFGVTEKVGVCRIKIAQRTLQRLRINIRQPFMLSFQLTLHQIGQIHVAECLLAFLVRFYLQVQCPVIDKTAAPKSLCKQDPLLICRIDSIFVGT